MKKLRLLFPVSFLFILPVYGVENSSIRSLCTNDTLTVKVKNSAAYAGANMNEADAYAGANIYPAHFALTPMTRNKTWNNPNILEKNGLTCVSVNKKENILFDSAILSQDKDTENLAKKILDSFNSKGPTAFLHICLPSLETPPYASLPKKKKAFVCWEPSDSLRSWAEIIEKAITKKKEHPDYAHIGGTVFLIPTYAEMPDIPYYYSCSVYKKGSKKIQYMPQKNEMFNENNIPCFSLIIEIKGTKRINGVDIAKKRKHRSASQPIPQLLFSE